MGPHDAKPEGLRKLILTEEAPHEAYQNRFEIARANHKIFGGTFFRLAQSYPRFYR